MYIHLLSKSHSFPLFLLSMESLSRFLSASPPLLNPSKNPKSASRSHIFLANCIPISNSKLIPLNSLQTTETLTPNHHSETTIVSDGFRKHLSSLIKPNLSLLLLGFSPPLACFASETAAAGEVSNRINLESILVSIDDFFTRYPFFVATVTFVWLVAIPLTEEYLQKYKVISAINAFNKLRDDPTSQLLDIRDSKILASLGSPNLKFLNKKTVQVEFREGDEEGFVKRVLQNFREPANTSVCIIDNFDGNSLKVAELLVKNGFKEAYAIRGGVRGKKGWQEIQETLLPPSVHIYPKEKAIKPKQLDSNGGITPKVAGNDGLPLYTDRLTTNNTTQEIIKNEDISSVSPTIQSKGGQRPQSPYPNYPNLKPPSSPTPSKPN